MIKGKIIVTSISGLHLRPAGLSCKEAMKYKSQILIRMNDIVANAKSVLSILGACVVCGDEIELICDGDDEKDAFVALKQLFENNLET